MAIQAQHTTDDETVVLTAEAATFYGEVVAFAGTLDRTTLLFWGTQIVAWLVVVGFALIWGIGGL
jgi:cytochrome c-type biogenesis protein CcmH/NrfF